MNKYFHHIGDFNAACRHLRRDEASIYLDLIHRYYDQEEPIMLNIPKLSRKLMRRGEEATDIEPIIKSILDEFFIETVDGYYNERCEFDLEHYQNGTGQKSKAGIASGKARRKKAKELRARGVKASSKSTDVEQTLNKNEQSFTTSNHNENQKPSIPTQKFEPDDMKVAVHIFSKLKELNPKQKEPNLKTWAEDINKLNRIDKRPLSQIMDVFDWANSDDFWSTNILSPSKLRKQYDTLLIKMGAVVKKESKLFLPRDDNDLWPWATKNGFPKPNGGEDFRTYRSRLQSLAEVRNNEG